MILVVYHQLAQRLRNADGFYLFIYFLFLSDEKPTLETLDFTIRVDSTPTFLV